MFAPVLLFALMNTKLRSNAIPHLISLGCLLTSIPLFSSAHGQAPPQSRISRWSSFVCAVLALFWVLVIEMVLPSLARAK